MIKDALIKSEKYYGKVFDLIIDLDVTSPLRNLKYINNCININKKEKKIICLQFARQEKILTLI